MLDLSFLTEEEQEAIMKVLQRDADLKKAEEERVRTLEETIDDTNEFKNKSGQWFYDAKSKRHRDKIHGADLIRASIRKKKPQTLVELSQSRNDKTKKSWVNNLNRDLFMPPELIGVVEEPEKENEEEKTRVQLYRSAPRVDSLALSENDGSTLKAVSSPSKQRKNPFNDPSLVNSFELPTENHISQNGAPNVYEIAENDMLVPSQKGQDIKIMPTVEFNEGRDISTVAAVEVRNEKPAPKPKARTVAYKISDLQSDSDSSPTKPAKKNDSMNGTGARRGILKRSPSSSSTDSEILRVSMDAQTKPVPPASPILEGELEKSPFGDQMDDSPQNSLDRLKQVRFTSVAPQTPDAQSGREIGEFDLLESDYAQNGTNGNEKFKHKDNDLRSFQRPVPVHSKTEKLDSDLPVPVSAGENADASLAVTLPSFSSNSDNNLQLSDGPKTELMPNSYVTRVQSLPEKSELLQERGTAAEDTNVRRPNGISVNILENGAPMIGNGLNNESVDLSDNALQTSKLMIDQQPIYAQIKSPRVSKLDPVDITQGNSSDESEPSCKTETVLVDPNLPKYDDQRDGSKVSLHAHQLQSNANVPVTEELRISNTIRGKAEGQIQYPISTEKIKEISKSHEEDILEIIDKTDVSPQTEFDAFKTALEKLHQESQDQQFNPNHKTVNLSIKKAFHAEEQLPYSSVSPNYVEEGEKLPGARAGTREKSPSPGQPTEEQVIFPKRIATQASPQEVMEVIEKSIALPAVNPDEFNTKVARLRVESSMMSPVLHVGILEAQTSVSTAGAENHLAFPKEEAFDSAEKIALTTEKRETEYNAEMNLMLKRPPLLSQPEAQKQMSTASLVEGVPNKDINKDINEVISKTACPPRAGPDKFNVNLNKLLLEESVPIASVHQSTSVVVKLDAKSVMAVQSAHELPTTDLQDEALVSGEVKPMLEKLPQWSSSTTQVKININDPKGKTLPKEVDEVILKTSVTRKAYLHNFHNGLEKPIMETSKMSHIMQKSPDEGNNLSPPSIEEKLSMSQGDYTAQGVAQLVVGRSEQTIDVIQQQNRQLVRLSNQPSIDKMSSGISGELLPETVLNEVAVSTIIPSNVSAQEVKTSLQKDDNPVPVSTVGVLQKMSVEIKSPEHQPSAHQILKAHPSPQVMETIELASTPLNPDAANTAPEALMPEKSLAYATAPGKPVVQAPVQDVKEVVVKMVSPKADFSEFNHGLKKLTIEYSCSNLRHQEESEQDTIQVDKSTQPMQSYTKFPVEEHIEGTAALKSEHVAFTTDVQNLKKESLRSSSTVYVKPADMQKTIEYFITAEQNHIEQPGKEPSTDGKLAAPPTQYIELHLEMSEKLENFTTLHDGILEEQKPARISRKEDQPQEVGEVIVNTVPPKAKINELEIGLPNVQEEAATTPVDENLLEKDTTPGEPEKVLHEEVKEVVVKTVTPKADLSELNSILRRLMMEATHSVPLNQEGRAQDKIQQVHSKPPEQSLPKFPEEAIVERTAAPKSEPSEFRAGLQKLEKESTMSTSTTCMKPQDIFKAPQIPVEIKHIQHPGREISTITEMAAPLNEYQEVNLQTNKQLKESSPLHHHTMEEQKISRLSIKEFQPQEAGDVIVQTVPQKTEFSEFKIGFPKLQKEVAKSPMVQNSLVNDTTQREPDEKVRHQDVKEVAVKIVSPQADLKDFNSGLRKLNMEASLSAPPNPEILAQEPIQKVTSTPQEHISPQFPEEEIVERVTAPKSELIEYNAGLEKLKRESIMSESTISLKTAELGNAREDSTPAEENHTEIYDPPDKVYSVLNTQVRKQHNNPNVSQHLIQLEEQKVSMQSVEEDHSIANPIKKMEPAKTELTELKIGKPSLQEVASTTPMAVLQKTPDVTKMEEKPYSSHRIPIQHPRPQVLQSEEKFYIPPKADIGESCPETEAAVYQNTFENKTTRGEPKENVLPQEVKEVVIKKELPKSDLYEFKSGLRKLAMEAEHATPVHKEENDPGLIQELISTPVEQRPPESPKAERVETVMAQNVFVESNAGSEKLKKEPMAWTPAVHEKTAEVVQTPVYSTPAEYSHVEHPTKVITTIVEKIDPSSASHNDVTTLVSRQSPQDQKGKLCTDEYESPEVRVVNVKTAIPAKVESSALKTGLQNLQSEESEPQITLLQKNLVAQSRTYSVHQSISEGPRKVALGALDGTRTPPTAVLHESLSVPEQIGHIVPLQEVEEVIGKSDAQKADPQQFNVALRNLFNESLRSVPSHEHVDQANACKVSKEQKLIENKGIVKMIAVPPKAELVKVIAGPENMQRVTATTTRSVLPEANRVVNVLEKHSIQEERIHTERPREDDVDIVVKTPLPIKLEDRNFHESLKVLHKEPYTPMHDQVREEKSSLESTKKEVLSQDLSKVVLKTTVPTKSDVIKSTQTLHLETSEPLQLAHKVMVVNECVNKNSQRPLKADLQETIDEPSSNQLAQNEEYSKMKISMNMQNMESSLPRSLKIEEEQPVKVLKEEAAPQEVKEIVVKKTVRPKIGRNDFNFGLKKLHDEASMPSVAVLQKATTEINLQRKDSSNEPEYITQHVVLAASSPPAFPTGVPTMSDTLQENKFAPLKGMTPIQDLPEVVVNSVTPKTDLYERNSSLMKLHLKASGPARESQRSSWRAKIDDEDYKLGKQSLLEYPKEELLEKTTIHPKTVSVEYQTGLVNLQRETLMSTSALCGKGDEGPRTLEEDGMHKKSNSMTYPPHVVQETSQPNVESSQLNTYLRNVPLNTKEEPGPLNLGTEEALSQEVKQVIESTVEPQKGSLTEFQMTLQKLQKRASKPLFPVLQKSTLVNIQEKDSTKRQIHFEPPKKEVVKTIEETSPASTLYHDVNVNQDHPTDTTSPVLFMSPELKTSLERPFDGALHQETQKVTIRTVTMPRVEMVKLGKHFTESSESPPAVEKVISKIQIQQRKPPQLPSTEEAESTGKSATASPSVDLHPASTRSWNFHSGQRNTFAGEHHFQPDVEVPHDPATKQKNDVTSRLMKTDTLTLNGLSETVNKVTLPPKTDSQEFNTGLEEPINNSSYPLNDATRKQISSAHSEELSSQEEEVVMARTVSSTRSGPTQESNSLESPTTTPTRIPIRQGRGKIAKIQRLLSAQIPFAKLMNLRQSSSDASEPMQEVFSKPVLKKYNVELSKPSKESSGSSSALGTAAFNPEDMHSTSKKNPQGVLKMSSESTKEASTNELGQWRRSVKLKLQHNNADEQYGKSDVLANEETMVQSVVSPKNEVSKFHVGFEKVHMDSLEAGIKLAQPTDNLQQEKLEMKLPLGPTIISSQKITLPNSDESNLREVQGKVSMKELQLAPMPQYQTENPLPTAVGGMVYVNTTQPGMLLPIGFEKLQLEASDTNPMLRNMKSDAVVSSENTDQGQKPNAIQTPSQLKDSWQGAEKTGQRRRSIKYIQLQYGGSDGASVSKEKVEPSEKTISMPKTQLMEPKTESVNILVPSAVFPEATSNKDEHFQPVQSKLSTKNLQIHPSVSLRSPQELSRAPEVLQNLTPTRVIEEKIDPVRISQSENFMPVDHLVDLSQPNYAPAVDWIPQVGAQNINNAEISPKGQVGYKAATSQFNEQKSKPVYDAAHSNVALVLTPLQPTEKYRGEIRPVEPEQSESIGVRIAHPERAQRVSTSTVRIANDPITLVKKSSIELHLVSPSDKDHLSRRFGITRHTGKVSSYERASRESPSDHF